MCTCMISSICTLLAGISDTHQATSIAAAAELVQRKLDSEAVEKVDVDRPETSKRRRSDTAAEKPSKPNFDVPDYDAMSDPELLTAWRRLRHELSSAQSDLSSRGRKVDKVIRVIMEKRVNARAWHYKWCRWFVYRERDLHPWDKSQFSEVWASQQ